MRKADKLKRSIIFIAAGLILAVLAGCSEPYSTPNKVMGLNFEMNKPLKYRFVSSRNVDLTLSDQKQKDTKEMTEQLEMVISYTPIEEDIYGDITVKAVCESSKVTKGSFSGSRQPGKDITESLAGREWTFKVNSLGQIRNFKGLNKLVEELGAATITKQATRNVKDPDMIWDFVNTQWFIWDPIAGQADAGKDITPGATWKSTQIIPFAKLVPAERRIHYTYAQADEEADNIKISGVIEKLPVKFDDNKQPMPEVTTLPKPYKVPHQMRGMFGFLTNYRVDSLQGSLEAVYDAQSAVLRSCRQEYDMKMTASFMLPLGDSVPKLDVKQIIKMELIE
ncbi:hypothetical protein SMSP2_01002 [Limihaloglobus sulfuriphilus]|uniref:Uncharacterized protein n=1 Tax=Limihaloglobus sulfuriphilus TaxID=1851148 RepID=A0A1Q2MEB5_9BACT|nr:hypothetical protein [Limihaloglobus sulfuriphilus]AQQ70647.1 hypothetical protein SMSP2_01002 [Limihaloglobus sulfuriphilus]